MPSGCAPILTSFISITTSSACSRCDENELRTTYAGMLGACEQANLVANEAKLIEPANAIIAFNCHLTHGHAGHAPDGQISHFLSSPSAKNIPLLRRPKSLLYPRHPVPHRATVLEVDRRSSRTLGTGCDGRGSVGRALAIAGRVLARERSGGVQTTDACCGRQSRVVLAPVAGVKLAEARQLDRVRQNLNPPTTVTRRIRRRGEREISRKTIAR